MAESRGPAEPARPAGGGRRLPRPLILAGVAVAALGSGAGIAFAATSGGATAAASATSVAASPSPSPSGPHGPARFFGPGHRKFNGPGFFGGPGGGLGGPVAFGGLLGGPGIFGAVHGQIVIPKPGGGYQTVDIQRGTVTAVSSTSITLKSADGFTKTYTVTSSTLVDAQRSGIGSIKVGNEASVVATQNGSVATASSITDLTLLRQGLPHLRPKFFPPVPSPSPSGTASSSGTASPSGTAG
jgi:hypothetical protein